MNNSTAVIHLADKRTVIQDSACKIQTTIPSENQQIVPLDFVHRFSENTLAPNESLMFVAPADCVIVIIPTVGALELLSDKNRPFITSGERFVKSLNKNQTVELSNAFADKFTNYIELVLNSNQSFNVADEIVQFELVQNQFQSLYLQDLLEIKIAKFDARNEALLENITHAFVYNLVGSFEVNGRLLHQNDSLSLQNINELDIEALSEENILLLIYEFND